MTSRKLAILGVFISQIGAFCSDTGSTPEKLSDPYAVTVGDFIFMTPYDHWSGDSFSMYKKYDSEQLEEDEDIDFGPSLLEWNPKYVTHPDKAIYRTMTLFELTEVEKDAVRGKFFKPRYFWDILEDGSNGVKPITEELKKYIKLYDKYALLPSRKDSIIGNMEDNFERDVYNCISRFFDEHGKHLDTSFDEFKQSLHLNMPQRGAFHIAPLMAFFAPVLRYNYTGVDQLESE